MSASSSFTTQRSRSLNQQAVLGHIQRSGARGRAEIARALGLSTQAVSNIIAGLTGDGLLVERGARSVGRGLPAVQYALNPSGAYALGIEVRPDAIFCALLDICGDAVATRRVGLTRATPDIVLDRVQAMQADILGATGTAPAKLLGAGVVMPGPFGQTGLSGQGSDLPGWQQTDARAAFKDALALPVELANDANAAAMAERISGVAQGIDSYAYLYFGAGLGLGLVQAGHLVTGGFGNAGEIGHIPVPCAGGPLPLESLLSRLSVQRHMARGPVDFDTLAALHEGRDPALADWTARAAKALGHAVQIIENLFDPQTIILGGAMPEPLLDALVMQARLPDASVSNRPDNPLPRLQRGASGRLTATLGAAALVLNRAFTPRNAALI